MKKWISILSFFVILTEVHAQVSVGETAPDFTLPALSNGETVTLSDFQGNVIYIFFYGAGCSHCRANGPVTETQIFQMFKDNENFRAFGIDTWNNTIAQNNSFKNVTGITYPLLLNGRQTLIDFYGTSSAYDRSVVIGTNNVVQYKGSFFVNNDYQDVVETIRAQLESIETTTEEDYSKPISLNLNQKYPNPFNPGTTISFELPEALNVKLTIFNTLGQSVSVLADQVFSAGTHLLTWDASEMPSGVYIYRLESGGQLFTRRMLLIK